MKIFHFARNEISWLHTPSQQKVANLQAFYWVQRFDEYQNTIDSLLFYGEKNTRMFKYCQVIQFDSPHVNV